MRKLAFALLVLLFVPALSRAETILHRDSETHSWRLANRSHPLVFAQACSVATYSTYPAERCSWLVPCSTMPAW